MTESLCSFCKLFGKPTVESNVIIVAGPPHTPMRWRIKHLLMESVEDNTPAKNLYQNYFKFMDTKNNIDISYSQPSSIESCTIDLNDSCCNGCEELSISSNGQLNIDEFESLRIKIYNYTHQSSNKSEPKQEAARSWIFIHGPHCFLPELLNIFLNLNVESITLPTIRFAVLGLLVNESKLFEYSIAKRLTLSEYKGGFYETHEKLTEAFFALLESSKYLQEHTLLVDASRDLTDIQLTEIVRSLFKSETSKYSACDPSVRLSMRKLLIYHERTLNDVQTVRKSLLRTFNEEEDSELSPIVSQLKNPKTAAGAANAAIQLVLTKFSYETKEKKQIYIRKLLVGINKSDCEFSNTVVGQMIFYALQLLSKYEESTIPLIHAIACVIIKVCKGSHFRHDLFRHTTEIFKLSLVLMEKKNYPLVICGLKLCVVILDADLNEHKYAHTFLTYDGLSSRKILDAIMWLLSPYQQLKKIGDGRTEAELNIEKGNSSYESITECYWEYTDLTRTQINLKTLSSLFYACFEHCSQVTEDDLSHIVDTIEILVDASMRSSFEIEGRSSTALLLAYDLCTLLTPILLNGPPSLQSAFINETRLLTIIPRSIEKSCKIGLCKMDQMNQSIWLYIHLIKLIVNIFPDREDICHAIKDKSDGKNIDVKDTELIQPQTNNLLLTKDLLVSYYTLQRQFNELLLSNETRLQHENIENLFEMEWKKIDALKLKHENEECKRTIESLNEKVKHVSAELQRTQLERDQFQKENIQMAHEIDRLKSTLQLNTVKNDPIPKCTQIEKDITHETNIINDTLNLLPYEVSHEKAKLFIDEIYRRRTTFKDEDMRKSICGSLKHLGSNLYSSPIHFLHELIQNAEDNIYESNISPFLRIQLNHDYILLSNNEQGLRACDVLAICSLAVSTKTSGKGHIGEKGVGFKSVFSASNKPMLISRSWKFQFQVPGSDEMSYITPLWVENIPECILEQVSQNQQNTHLYLPLKLTPHTPLAKQFLDDVSTAVDSCILLNMRQLKKFEIVDERENKRISIEKEHISSTELKTQECVTFEGCTFRNLNGSITRLCTPLGYRTFRVYQCQIDVPNTIEQQRNPTTSLTMAFPCEHDYVLNVTVYNGLPVCDLGFNFIFNAEFCLVTNRESVRENDQFNDYLRNHLAVLFVYLLLNDVDLKKNKGHYCPTTNIHQVKHSIWWLSMIDRINQLVTKYISILFGIDTGKAIRYYNPNFASLISKHQLFSYGNIEVVDENDEFWTNERLRHFQITPVSIKDVLECFPNRSEKINEFQLWTEKQDEKWWSQFFCHLSQEMNSEISNLFLKKPIFLVNDNCRRQYLSEEVGNSVLLYITTDSLSPVWKRQITHLQYKSEAEKEALLRSNKVQVLTEKTMIQIIQTDHLQLALALDTTFCDKLLEEIWKDLSYLHTRISKLDKSKPILVPVHGSRNLDLIQNATLPTIFGVNITSFINSTVVNFARSPYFNVNENSLINSLEWEYFLLKLNCKPPSIKLREDVLITDLQILPLFKMFPDERSIQFAEFIFSAQPECTQQSLKGFPIVAQVNSQEQIRPISTTFDQSITLDLPSLPQINVPYYCRSLATKMGVNTQFDLNVCITVLQYLNDEKISDIDLYIEWLGRLQLELRHKDNMTNKENFLEICHLYFPDKQRFCPLKNILVLSEMNEPFHQSTLLACKYLGLELISPTSNQIYWQFQNLFHLLGCQDNVTIEHIYKTILLARDDKNNFLPLGNEVTMLSENGYQNFISLLQHLEDLLVKYIVINSTKDTKLYDIVITNRHPTAPYGSRDDLNWRFTLASSSVSSMLKRLIDSPLLNTPLPLLTIDRQLVTKESINIVYAGFETKIMQHFLRSFDKRRFISSHISRTCPIVLELCGIDYIERHLSIEWQHKVNDMETQYAELSKIFQETTNSQLKVLASKLIYSTLTILDTSNDGKNGVGGFDSYKLETEYSFLIFDNWVLLPTGYSRNNYHFASIAASALAAFLHKHNYMPLDEAKLIARRRIEKWNQAEPGSLIEVVDDNKGIYSCSQMIFPIENDTIDIIPISIGPTVQIGQNHQTIFISPTYAEVYKAYKTRLLEQDHRTLTPRLPNNWLNPEIVDGEKNIVIGQNAEYFFFAYLQKLYGDINVTPIKNWRSSARLKFYPNHVRMIDDSAGYDIELQDINEYFVQGNGKGSKRCYFEVKGTSGLFHEENSSFHISSNEYHKCQDVERHSNEAYFVVIIERCLDPQMISLVKVFKWSNNSYSISMNPNSYQCFFNSQTRDRQSANNYQSSSNSHHEATASEPSHNQTFLSHRGRASYNNQNQQNRSRYPAGSSWRYNGKSYQHRQSQD